MDTTDQITQDFFSVIPENIQAIITSGSWRSPIEVIAKKYTLTEDQWTNLETEVFVTLLCMENVKDLAKNIENSLVIPPELSLKITAELYNTVFKDIYTTLSKIVDEIDALSETQRIADLAVEKNIEKNTETPKPVETKPKDWVPVGYRVPEAPVPENLPMMQEHHDLMKYYAGTEPIQPGLPELKPKNNQNNQNQKPEEKNTVETPRYGG